MLVLQEPIIIKKTYKFNSKCGDCQYIEGQKGCDWMNCYDKKSEKEEASLVPSRSATSPLTNSFGQNWSS